MLGYCGRYSECKNKNYNSGLFWEVFRVQQRKLQCKNIVGDIQCATTTKTTMQGYCGRYSGCNDNRNYNAGDIWGAPTTETTMLEIFKVQRQQKPQCRAIVGDIQGATTTETTMQEIFRVQQQKLQCRAIVRKIRVQQQRKLQCSAIARDIQGARTAETTMQSYCGRYLGCNGNRNYNAGLLRKIFRVQRQQKLQCRAIIGDI